MILSLDEFIQTYIGNPIINRNEEIEKEFFDKNIPAADFLFEVYNKAHPITYQDGSHGLGLGSYEIVKLVRKFI